MKRSSRSSTRRCLIASRKRIAFLDFAPRPLEHANLPQRFLGQSIERNKEKSCLKYTKTFLSDRDHTSAWSLVQKERHYG